MSYATIAALRADCEELLRKFQLTDSVRYLQFCNVWKGMDFGAILRYPMLQPRRLQFMEECYLMALSFCHPMHPFQYRTGGLYLLYAFYFKQTGDYFVKVRITQQQWKDIEEYIEEAKEQGHHDIHYVYQKLILNHAFHFVASPRELAPFYYDVGTTEKDNFYTLHSSVKEFCEEGYFDQLQNYHQAYVAEKKKGDFSDVGSIQEDLMIDLLSLMKEFDTKRVEKLVGAYAFKEDLDNAENIGSRRIKLKKDLMKRTSIASQSRRHRAVELEKGSKKTSKKRGRKSTSLAEEVSLTEQAELVIKQDQSATVEDHLVAKGSRFTLVPITEVHTVSSGNLRIHEENSSQDMPMLTIDESP